MQDAQRDHSRAIAAQRDAEKKREFSTKTLAQNALTGAEVALGAGLMGWLAGRMGSTTIGSTGIPLGLAVGVAGHLAAAFNVLPARVQPHVVNVANGSIAAWATLWGAGQGSQARANAGGAPGGIVAGTLPAYAPPASIGYRPPIPATPVHMLPPPNAFAANAPRPLNEAELQTLAHSIPVRFAA